MIPLILSGVFLILPLLISSANGMLVPMTTLEHYAKDDMILVGKVISLEENSSKSETTYQIMVEKYLKNPQTFDTITAIGQGAHNSTAHTSIEKIFEKGQRVLLFLNKFDENYIISPYSVNAMNFDADSFIPPPSKQVKVGVAAKDIVCSDDLKLVFKRIDNSPACVKPSSFSILVQRSWTK